MNAELPTTQPHRISVVIPFWKGDEYIVKCVTSIKSSTAKVENLIVVDNSPTTFPWDTLHLGDIPLTIVRSRSSLGFARAVNIGILRAKELGATRVAIINQDSYILADTLELLSHTLDSYRDAFVATPISLAYDSSTISEFFLQTYVRAAPRLLKDYLSGSLADAYPVEFNGTNGSCMMMDCVTLGKVGLFDPLFSMYGEDWDIFRRAKHLGYQILIVPKASHHHAHTLSSLRHSIGGSSALNTNLALAGLLLTIKNPKISALRALKHVLLPILREQFQLVASGNLRQVMQQLFQGVTLIPTVCAALLHRNRFLLNIRITLQAQQDRK